MKFKLFLSFVFLLYAEVFSQKKIDQTLRLNSKRKFIAGIDARSSYDHGNRNVIYGIYSGIDFNNDFRFKVVVSGTPFNDFQTTDNQDLVRYSNLFFVSINEEIDFIKFKKSFVTSYVQTGIGRENFTYSKEIATPRFTNKYIFPSELGLLYNIKIKELGVIRMGGGYRFVLPSLSASHLNGVFFRLGGKVNAREILKLYKSKKLN